MRPDVTTARRSVADDRAGDPARGARPDGRGSDAGRGGSPVRPGSPLGPFRVPVATRSNGARPAIVPLTRRRGPRLGLRPPGAALPTAPVATGPARSPADAVTLPPGRIPAERTRPARETAGPTAATRAPAAP